MGPCDGRPHRPTLDRPGLDLRAAFSRDGKILATANDNNTVWLWDPVTDKRIGKPLVGHYFSVSGVAFSPDGKSLASASTDDTIRIWDQPWNIDRACELAVKYVTAGQVNEYLHRPGTRPRLAT